MSGSSRLVRALLGVAVGTIGFGVSACSKPPVLLPVGDTPAARVDWLLPGGVQLNAVALSDSGPGAAAGEFGTLLVTSDAGATWTAHPYVTRESLKAVAFGDRNMGVAAGTNGAILRTEDGKTWAPVTSGSSITLRGAAFGSPAVAIVVGDAGTILKSEDAGRSWRSVPSGTTATLRAVRFLTASAIVAAGDGGTVLSSPDIGATWQRRESGTSAALRGLHFSSATNGVAVGGDDLRLRAERTIIRTSDGGVTWQPATVPTGKRLYATTTANTAQVIALGEKGAVLKSVDDGQTWAAAGEPVAGTGRGGGADNDTSNWFASVSTSNGTTVAVTYGGRIYRSTDAAVTWKVVPQPPVAENVAAVARVDGSTFVAVAGGAIFRSADGAPVARMQSPPAGGRGRAGAPTLMSVQFPAWAVGVTTGAAGMILRTVDGGRTWTSINSPTKRNLRGVAFADEKVGVAVAGPAGTGAGMIRTDDGGLTWREQECVAGTRICESSTPLFAVALLPSQFGIAVGGPNGGPALIVRTTDGGRHWTQLTLSEKAAKSSLQAVALIDERHAVAVGSGGVILHTSDGGETWAIRDPASSVNLTGVAFADASRGLIVGVGGTIFVTSDGGATWLREAPFTTRDLWAVQFQDPTTAIITGSPGVLLRHTWTGGTSTNSSSSGRGGNHE